MSTKKEFLLYGIVVLLSFIIIFFTFRLYKIDLHVPFQYNGDALHVLATAKTMIDNGWYLENKFLAWPSGFQIYDFPLGDNNLNLLLIKIITLFSQDAALSVNIFYLLTFILTVLTATYAGKKLGLSFGMTIFFALSFSFLPYHFRRGISHLYLSAYYAVPLAILTAVWIAESKITFNKPLRHNAPALAAFIFCIIIGSTGVYYAFFSCFFFLIAGWLAYLKEKSKKILIIPILLVSTIFGVFLINNTPTFIYQHINGGNKMAVHRGPSESEYFGLAISHLIIPSVSHRLKEVAIISHKIFNLDIFDKSEKLYVPIGLFASLGFLYLLWRLITIPFAANNNQPENQRLTILSIFNVLALLLGAIGSFGFLIAALFAPQIRSYNRLSIFIAGFALLAVAILLDKLIYLFWQNNSWLDLKNSLKNKKIYFVLFFCPLVICAIYLIFFAQYLWQVALIGLLPIIVLLIIFQKDYSKTPSYFLFGYFVILSVTIFFVEIPTPYFYRQYENIKKSYYNDKKIVTTIEGQVGVGGKIFQIPYQDFPDAQAINSMQAYEHFRPYLHSEQLYWSFGTMQGRPASAEYERIAALPTTELIATLKKIGYNGLLLNQRGYADNGTEKVKEISDILKTKPLTDEVGGAVFFPLN